MKILYRKPEDFLNFLKRTEVEDCEIFCEDDKNYSSFQFRWDGDVVEFTAFTQPQSVEIDNDWENERKGLVANIEKFKQKIRALGIKIVDGEIELS